MATKQALRTAAVKRFFKAELKRLESTSMLSRSSSVPPWAGKTWEVDGEQIFSNGYIAIVFFPDASLPDLPKSEVLGPDVKKLMETFFAAHTYKVKKFDCRSAVSLECPVFIRNQWYNGKLFVQMFDFFGVKELYLNQPDKKNEMASINVPNVGYGFIMPLKYGNYQGKVIDVCEC